MSTNPPAQAVAPTGNPRVLQAQANPVPPTAPAARPQGEVRAGSLTVSNTTRTAQDAMLQKADGVVAKARQDFKLDQKPLPPPRDHFERVSRTLDTHRRLEQLSASEPKAKEAADRLLSDLQQTGRAWKVNFGLSSNGRPLNDREILGSESSLATTGLQAQFNAAKDEALLNNDPDKSTISRAELQAATLNQKLPAPLRAAAAAVLRQYGADPFTSRYQAWDSERMVLPALRSASATSSGPHEVSMEISNQITRIAWREPGGQSNQVSQQGLDLAREELRGYERNRGGTGWTQEKIDQQRAVLDAVQNVLNENQGKPVALDRVTPVVLAQLTQESPQGVGQVSVDSLIGRLDKHDVYGEDQKDKKVERREIVNELLYGRLSPPERWMLNRVLQERYPSQGHVANPPSRDVLGDWMRNLQENVKPVTPQSPVEVQTS
jgi:hypothetical protein